LARTVSVRSSLTYPALDTGPSPTAGRARRMTGPIGCSRDQ
jgi:hypothetical protein